MLLGTIFNTLHLDLLGVYRKVDRQVQCATPPPPFPVSPLGRELAPAQPSGGGPPAKEPIHPRVLLRLARSPLPPPETPLGTSRPGSGEQVCCSRVHGGFAIPSSGSALTISIF